MTTTATLPALTGNWRADEIHSSASFAVRHMGVANFRGSFDHVDAALDFSNGEPALRGAVNVESIDVRDENLRPHLLSPDFFDAERTPEISFESRALQLASDGTLELTGTLTVKGHAEDVTATGTLAHIEADMGGGERIGVELHTVIDRTRYGLDWNAPLPKGGFALANDVRLDIHLEFVPEAQ